MAKKNESSVARYLIKRVLLSIPLLLVITILTFLLVRIAPGDPTKMFISPRTRPEDREQIRRNLGLDRPLYVQYGIWLKNLVTRGDLGFSLVNGRPVLESIMERVPATLVLMGTAYVLSIILALPLGIYSAVRQYSFFDYVFTIFSFVGISLPPFWLALMAIYYFSLRWDLFPPMGMTNLVEGSPLELGVDLLWHLFLPVMVLTVRNLATWSRYIRSSLLEVLGEDYIRTAYSKGLSEVQVIWRHALRNSLLPLITIIALSLPEILAGAFIIEFIFAWPGMGRLGMEAVFHRDYTILMGDIFISSILVVFANIIADMCYSLVDPRIRLEGTS
ncbi:MAG: ABC transporter permease [Candidatus Eremiobacteraeota bacterium]|nr:ABC transporter permease [Candidatus Eremiobacteraeota bacterium]